MSNNETPYVTEHDWSEVPPPTAVVEAVAELSDRTADDLDPLYNHIDPDALTNLLENGTHERDTEISFQFETYHVTVRSDGRLAVDSIDSP